MNAIICYSCQTPSSANAKFCLECGNMLSCKSCQTQLVQGAKFCVECGEDVKKTSTTANQPNTLSYHKKGDEIRCEVAVSDEVGKEGFKTLVQSLVQGNAPQQYKLTSTDKTTEDIVYQLENETQPDQIQQATVSKEEKNESPIAANNNTAGNYPHIDDLLRRKKYNETEWILVFAFYESKYGVDSFTRDQIRSAYLNKRKNDSRLKNFATNWSTLRKMFFNTVSEDVFAIDYDKISTVSGLIEGTVQNVTAGAYSKSKPTTENKGKKEKPIASSKSTGSAKHIAFEEFDLIKNDTKPALLDLYTKHTPRGNKLIFGMIAYYITAYNKTETFTAGNIDYAYKILKITRKNNLIQVINNVKNETTWFEGVGSGTWKVTRYGEVELEKLFGQ